jgi:ankyrin repeat protein
VNARSKITGETPLHIAVGQRKVGLAKALILRGANANVETNGGKTPLNLAIANRVDTQLIELMIKEGATCDVQAIHCRAREKKIRELIRRNSMSTVSSSVGERPLRQRLRFSSISSWRSN